MTYCIKCGLEAELCYGEAKKVTLDEYKHEAKECQDLKCYCKKQIPTR